MSRTKAQQIGQVISMQEKHSRLDKNGNLLNISSSSAISGGGKKSHP
jgi:hypothetical protein